MLPCPICYREMRQVMESGIELDLCDHCVSIWLDEGELNAIAKACPAFFGTLDVTNTTLCDRLCPRCNHNDFCGLCFTVPTDCERGTIQIARCNGCGGSHVDSEMLERLCVMASQLQPEFANESHLSTGKKTIEVADENATVHTVADVALTGGLELLFSILLSL